jgi:glycosyltransferase involved in cell wall biosynthesis
VQTGRARYVFLVPWALTPGSGVNAVVLGLAEAMRPDYDPVFVVTGWDAPPPGQTWLKLPVPGPGLRDALGFLARLAPNLVRLRKATRGAVGVNPHFVGLELLPLLLLRRLRLCPRVILSVHGADIAEAGNSSRWTRTLFAWMLSSADLVVACSRALAAQVRILSPRARVIAVWNAVPPRPEPLLTPRPIDARYLISVAHFVRKKAHDVLLRAFQIVARERPDLRLVLIGGEGPERQPVMSLISTLGLAGNVDVMVNVPRGEVWRWISHAECLILPSRDEPFGIVLLEAAVVDTPVVATRVGGVPEFLTDKVHGLLCEPDRPDEIAQAVLTTLADRAMTESRTRLFHEQAKGFTWQRAFARYRAKAGLPGGPV